MRWFLVFVLFKAFADAGASNFETIDFYAQHEYLR
jgi:hypothetical protein